MIKITIKGEAFDFDNVHYPLSEAIDLERATGIPFGIWQTTGLASGSAVSLAGLVWLVLKRAGRDVPIADIMSGKYPLETIDISEQEDNGGDAAGPTSPGSEPPETSGSPGSPGSTAPPSSP